MHQQNLRSPRHVRVYRDGEDKLVVLPVEVIELIAPEVLDVARVDEAVAVGGALDEHHGRQVVNVPAGGDFDEPRLLALDERLHPVGRLLLVVDVGPRVTRSQEVRLAVVVAHAVVVFDAVVEEELPAFFTAFPPMYTHTGQSQLISHWQD